jgi:hypothetical protein
MTIQRRFPFRAAVAALLGVVLLNRAEAQVPPIQAKQSRIDPKADQVLRQMVDFCKSLKSASVEITTEYQGEFGEDGRAFLSKVMTWSVAFQQPDRFASRLTKGKGLTTWIITDGTKTAIYRHWGGHTKLSVGDQPLERSTCTSGLLFKGVLTLDESFLIHKDLYGSIMDPIKGGQYVGLEQTDKDECHHLRFFEKEVLVFGDVTWDLWVQSGPQPLVRKVIIVPSEKRIKHTEPPIIFETLEKVTKTFSNWSVNPDLPKETFAIPPPPKDE